jgi:exonuclease V gamma subunit
MLPPGAAGLLALEAALGPARAIARAKQQRFAGKPQRPRVLELEIAGVRLHMTVGTAYPNALLEMSYSKLGKRAETRAFMQHVLACALRGHADESLPAQTVVIAAGDGHDGADIATFRPVEAAGRLLERWVEIAREAQTHPLPLEHDASRACAEALHAGLSTESARKAAQQKWRDKDPYAQLVGEGATVLADPRFSQLACDVFLPLFQHRLPVEQVP